MIPTLDSSDRAIKECAYDSGKCLRDYVRLGIIRPSCDLSMVVSFYVALSTPLTRHAL